MTCAEGMTLVKNTADEKTKVVARGGTCKWNCDATCFTCKGKTETDCLSCYTPKEGEKPKKLEEGKCVDGFGKIISAMVGLFLFLF